MSAIKPNTTLRKILPRCAQISILFSSCWTTGIATTDSTTIPVQTHFHLCHSPTSTESTPPKSQQAAQSSHPPPSPHIAPPPCCTAGQRLPPTAMIVALRCWRWCTLSPGWLVPAGVWAAPALDKQVGEAGQMRLYALSGVHGPERAEHGPTRCASSCAASKALVLEAQPRPARRRRRPGRRRPGLPVERLGCWR